MCGEIQWFTEIDSLPLSARMREHERNQCAERMGAAVVVMNDLWPFVCEMLQRAILRLRAAYATFNASKHVSVAIEESAGVATLARRLGCVPSNTVAGLFFGSSHGH